MLAHLTITQNGEKVKTKMPSKTASSLEKILPKNWLPPRWKEMERLGYENQIVIRLCHISPLLKVDAKIFQPRILSSTPSEQVSAIDVKTPAGMQPMADFFKGMKAAAETGLVPGYTPQKVEEMRKMISPHHPEESDYDADITIAKFADEKTALQSLENYGLYPTRGFDVPIPGMPKIPGMPENITFLDWLKSDIYKDHIPKEQLEEMRKVAGKVQEEIMKEVKTDYLRSGLSYKKGKYLGCDAIFLEGKGEKNCVAMRVKNFVITGSLLFAANSLPRGDTPCDSLTKLDPKPKIVRAMTGDGPVTFKEYRPAKGTYATEGYLHREEVENIFSSIFSRIEGVGET